MTGRTERQTSRKDTEVEGTVRAAGTESINRIENKNNSSVVHIVKPNKRSVEVDWRDPDFDGDQGCYYYIRVIQSNGEEAISSPIWID